MRFNLGYTLCSCPRPVHQMMMCPCKVLALRAKTKMKEATLSNPPVATKGQFVLAERVFDISLIEWPKYNNPYIGFASCRFNHRPCVHLNRPMSDVVLLNFSFTHWVEIFPSPLLLLLLYLWTASSTTPHSGGFPCLAWSKGLTRAMWI